MIDRNVINGVLTQLYLSIKCLRKKSVNRFYKSFFSPFQQFDKDGNLLRWPGSPILLDNKIPRDPEVLKLLAKYRPEVEALTNDVLGISKVELTKNCTNYECNLGNFITDAWIHSRVEEYNGTGWTDASIAFINAGAIRSAATIGDLSQFELTTVLPFNNTLYVVQVPGRNLKAALEYTVSDYVIGGYVRNFLQMSGAHVVYNLNKSPGQRVQSVEILCANCGTPVYEPLNEEKIYGVILESYVYKGGDGFTMFDVSSTFGFIHSYFVSSFNSMSGEIQEFPSRTVECY